MVKKRKKHTTKKRDSKACSNNGSEARKIKASTPYGTCTERLSPFGGLLGLVKFLDLMGFKEIFEHTYKGPKRSPKLGHYRMVMGVLMLLFIGFNRLWHFIYIRLDAMVCGIFGLNCLPVPSTFWRYVDSLGINQANSLVNIMSIVRERVWQQCHLKYQKIHVSADTTADTVYGNQQGARKGYSPWRRGKKAYCPVLCFIPACRPQPGRDETKEYLIGKLRKGETLSGQEAATIIKKIKSHLPGCVKKVVLRADGEFFSCQTVQSCVDEG